MSEKKAKEERKEQETVNMTYRIDLEMGKDPSKKTTYMIVSGVPKNLPESMYDSVKYAAQAQFVSALNERKFIEVYNEGKTSKDEMPILVNLSMLESIKVTDIVLINN